MRVAYCRSEVRELASGVDALYLSGQADLPTSLADRLEKARSSSEDLDASVHFAFGGYDWEMQPFGLGRYRYRLDHPLAVLGITTKEKLPTFRAQARAEALHSPMGPRGVARWIDSATTNENLDTTWTVSRIDLYADCQGWQLNGNERHRFICRAKKLTTYEDDTHFTGFTFGNRKSKTVNARIYDKTRELAGNGHDWWYEIWGDRFDPEQPVLRVEFEIHRAMLREMGLGHPNETLDAVDRLWAYGVQDWLTFRRATAHERPARWPLANEWQRLQRFSLAGNALPMERIRAGRSAGALRTLMPGLNGYVSGFASWIGVDTIEEACDHLPEYLRAYEQQSRRSFCERVTEKRKSRT